MAKKVTRKKTTGKASGNEHGNGAAVATEDRPKLGLGRKYCKGCGEVIPARATSHDCGWKLEKSKSNGKAKGKPGRKAATVKAAGFEIGNGSPAIAFIRAVGGLGPAKAALAELEALKGLL